MVAVITEEVEIIVDATIEEMTAETIASLEKKRKKINFSYLINRKSWKHMFPDFFLQPSFLKYSLITFKVINSF